MFTVPTGAVTALSSATNGAGEAMITNMGSLAAFILGVVVIGFTIALVKRGLGKIGF